MKFIILLGCVLTLGACAVSTPVYTPSGKRGYNIDCSGDALNWGACYQKAGDICGARGYTVVEKDGGQGAVVSGNQYGMFGGSITHRTMMIQCK